MQIVTGHIYNHIIVMYFHATVMHVVYAGDRDCVVCFKCGGRLKNWQPDEDPWEEHAKHYPG